MRWIMAAVFGTMMLISVAAGHYYLWRRLLHDTGLSRRWKRGLTVLLFLLGAIFPLAFLLSRVAIELRPLFFLGFFWLGMVFYLVLLLGLWDGARALVRLKRFVGKRLSNRGVEEVSCSRDAEALERTGNKKLADKAAFQEEGENGNDSRKGEDKCLKNPDRRIFLARTAAATSLAGAGAIGLIGLRYAKFHVETPEIPVKLARLPAELSGFKIAVLSDLHIGPTLRESFTRRVVDMTNGLKPDMTVLLGDIVDGPVSLIGGDVKPLGGLRAPHGVFFVTGNHEYYSGAKEWVHFIKRIGIRVLMNERVSIGDKHPGGETFDLAGIGDRRAGMFVKSHAQNIGKAVRGRVDERELVVLAHQPSQISHVEKVNPGLQISGHTHGGQIWPWTYAVRLAEPYLCGLYRHNENTQVFVTRGVGYWGPPIRFLAPAEIPCLVLQRA